MKVLVLGAGATGGYFGGRLAEAGGDVTFLVRPARAEHLRASGLVLESPYGDARLAVRAVLVEAVRPEYDVVLLACKSYDLDTAIESIRPALRPGSAVLPVLNGIAHLARLEAAFGRSAVLGGTARIQATVTATGSIRQFNDWNTLTFGELDGTLSARVRDFAAAFAPAKGVTVKPVTDIAGQLWEKLVHLATAATLTTLMRANVGEIVRTPEGGALFQETLDTMARIATANGHPPSDAFLASYRRIFAERDSGYSTSMLRDIERGARIEGDHVVGFMLAEARRLQLDDRTLRLAHTALKAYEERRAASRLPAGGVS